MYKKAILIIVICGVLFAACKHATIYKEVQAPNLFTMQIPSYMHATGELFRGGKPCLQYENDSAQIYLLVFDTSRKGLSESTLQAFYDSIVANPDIKDAKIAQPKFAILNKDSTLFTEMTGESYGVRTFYRIQVVATPPRFYYILLWTKEEKKEAMKEDFDKIMASFTDLKEY